MIVLPNAGLVLLEVPKTATQAVRGMLAPFRPEQGWPFPRAGRHLHAPAYHELWRGKVETAFGRPFETVCVVRDPLERVESWYRYRKRSSLAGQPESTRGLSFLVFMAAMLELEPPEFAQVGRQDRFCGWNGATALVDHIFDYRRLDLFTGFLSARLGRQLDLPQRNASPVAPSDDPLKGVPAVLLARHRTARAGEFALYDRVAAAGHLRLPAALPKLAAVSSSAR
jgi:hypothetical protein